MYFLVLLKSYLNYNKTSKQDLIRIIIDILLLTVLLKYIFVGWSLIYIRNNILDSIVY